MYEKNFVVDTQLKLNLTKDYPTNRGHYPNTIQDTAHIQEILMAGSCRPMGPYQYKDGNRKMVTNFNSSYYHQFVDNIQIQRGWLCNCLELMKSYCEVCRLFFADSSKLIFDLMAWVNVVSGTTHKILEKTKRHEKTASHFESSAIYLKWMSSKTLDQWFSTYL